LQSRTNWKRTCIPGTRYTSTPANLSDPPSDFSEGLVLRLRVGGVYPGSLSSSPILRCWRSQDAELAVGRVHPCKYESTSPSATSSTCSQLEMKASTAFLCYGNNFSYSILPPAMLRALSRFHCFVSMFSINATCMKSST